MCTKQACNARAMHWAAGAVAGAVVACRRAVAAHVGVAPVLRAGPYPTRRAAAGRASTQCARGASARGRSAAARLRPRRGACPGHPRRGPLPRQTPLASAQRPPYPRLSSGSRHSSGARRARRTSGWPPPSSAAAAATAATARASSHAGRRPRPGAAPPAGAAIFLLGAAASAAGDRRPSRRSASSCAASSACCRASAAHCSCTYLRRARAASHPQAQALDARALTAWSAPQSARAGRLPPQASGRRAARPAPWAGRQRRRGPQSPRPRPLLADAHVGAMCRAWGQGGGGRARRGGGGAGGGRT